MERCSGVLMSMSSLPSPYGIGTMGKCAYDFVDFLKASGQKYWQLLPLGPTSYGDSPYSSFSTFAGNPYLIDLDMLIEDGILLKEDMEGINWGDNAALVDYSLLYENRFKVLYKAYGRRTDLDKWDTGLFRSENPWVENYALYMALKEHFENKCWIDWPDEAIRVRKPEAVEKYTAQLKDRVEFYVFVQTLFFRQWKKLRAYAKKNGILFIGDIPIYVALDSSDVWSEPYFFQLDENYVPTVVAGCPPDAFSEDGQLWGNPIYDYDKMKQDGYGWWIRRIGGASKLYDVIRIDHFRGLESYWAIPYGSKTAAKGKWVPGPGIHMVKAISGWFKDMSFIAEDLGYMTPEVKNMVKESGFPSMKVMEFAFDAHGDSDYLPHCCNENSTCYLGTHDNDTVLGWVEQMSKEDKAFAVKYMHITEDEGWCWGMIRSGMATRSALFVMQMQDILELGRDARMNIPGILGGLNWRWRMLPGAITEELTAKLLDYTKTYRRVETKKPTAEVKKEPVIVETKR